MDVISLLRNHGVSPTPQRISIAEFILGTASHPSADEVWEKVQRSCPTLSRATVYNTLKLLAEKGLLRVQAIRNGALVFDPNVVPHHHFIDDETGRVYDVPWDAVAVTGAASLKEFEVRECQVVMRGRKR